MEGWSLSKNVSRFRGDTARLAIFRIANATLPNTGIALQRLCVVEKITNSRTISEPRRQMARLFDFYPEFRDLAGSYCFEPHRIVLRSTSKTYHGQGKNSMRGSKRA